MKDSGFANISVNAKRLWEDLNELSRIGRDGISPGISRVAFSASDMRGRKWLLERFKEAGLHSSIDSVGNVIGRLDTAKSAAKSAIILGSHTDTVPSGGMFDGALGVLGALECIRSLVEKGVVLEHPVYVVSFSNEEGGMTGSRALFRGIDQSEWETVRSLLNAGEVSAPPPPLFSRNCAGYLELHVEQGGVLDAAGEDIGVVEGIVCIHSFDVVFKGHANHAGTTPMHQRKDALLGAARFVVDVGDAVTSLGSGQSVATCGQISVTPGGRNVIPGTAKVSVETRDLDDMVACRIVQGLRKRAAFIAEEMGLQVFLTETSVIPAVLTHGTVRDAVEMSAEEMGLKCRRMASGAGHDCMIAAKVMPADMVFVPSKNGVSHSPDEWTDEKQCENGANVLLRALLRLDAAL